MLRRILPVVFALALVAAACGSDGSDDPADVSAGDPPVASICKEGEADCDDAVQPGEPGEPVAEDPGSVDSGPVTSTGTLVNGGLTVEEALETDAVGVLAVKGFLVADGTTIRFCSALLESFPVQCGGASVVVDAPDVESLVFDDEIPLVREQGVTWTDQTIVLLGELIDGVLVVDLLVAG